MIKRYVAIIGLIVTVLVVTVFFVRPMNSVEDNETIQRIVEEQEDPRHP